MFTIAVLTMVFTLLGGLLAIYYKDKLHLIIGFSAGAVIAVALFDLIPESLSMASSYNTSFVVGLIALGFILYMVVDRIFNLHSHEHDHCCDEHLTASGKFGATALTIHSLMDGISVGIAFQISPVIGLIVAIAVLAHKFADGLNTVNIVFNNFGKNKDAFIWLLVASIAPVIGILLSSLIVLPETIMGLVLAVFAGLFLYLGASNLIPESYHKHPSFWTTASTILGMLVIWLVIYLYGG